MLLLYSKVKVFSTKHFWNKFIYCVFYVKITATKKFTSFTWPFGDIERMADHSLRVDTLALEMSKVVDKVLDFSNKEQKSCRTTCTKLACAYCAVKEAQIREQMSDPKTS